MWKPGQIVTRDSKKFRVKKLTKEEVINLVTNHGYTYEYDPDLPVQDGCFLVTKSSRSIPSLF